MIALKQTCTQCRDDKLTLRPRAKFVCNDCKQSLHDKQWRELQKINNGNIEERRNI